MERLFNTTHISVDLAHHEIFHAKFGKGGIKSLPLAKKSSLLKTGHEK